ncbi:MAG: alpha/beta fold hydrolase [Actinobacteria bacterium]|nr:alpha/beta fold hydrolase [Actinomycetota bacterium]
MSGVGGAVDEPQLYVDPPNGPVRAVALVLHGGRSRSVETVPDRSLAVLRMVPFARALRRATAGRDLAVARLIFRVRGWNGERRSPVADARWALDELTRRFPGQPIGLVGHSMGGRTALYAADHGGVRSVVLLAPWIEPGDPFRPLAGRRVLIVHGSADRTTDPRNSAALADRARSVADQVTFVDMSREGHAMLRRARQWHDLAAGFTVGALLEGAPEGSGRRPWTKVVRQALAGATLLQG